ncbi:unnamed protein product [Lymnaea stagnalis]|uniref:Nuclear speckle splicing regulatory protein 1 N-terminal domain-containing protein n=1 Tax=Lymnaea stagnalis TaxID=6523 RepID=A0AAV2IEA3_LYMST
MATKGNKVYGLIIPKKDGQIKSKPSKASAFNVFGNESDEEETSSATGVSAVKTSGPSTVKRQTQMDIDKALQEDPNIYEYDAIYDKLQANKPHVGLKEKSTMEKKPRYISGLLKAAEVKKKEDERRKERQVQKEREAEGEMFADKEKFVTSAYKQKMLEMQKEEEKEKQEAAMENLLDVTKQKDMSGFYRYLYRTTAGTEGTQNPSGDDSSLIKDENIKKECSPEDNENPPTQPKDKESSPSSSSSSSSTGSSTSSHSESSGEEEEAGKADKIEFSKPSRPNKGGQFRKRAADSSSPEPDRKHSHHPRSLDSRRHSRSPVRRKQSRSPVSKRHSRSRSPVRKRYTRSPVTKRHSSSRSPIRKKHSRSPFRKRHSRSRSPRGKRNREGKERHHGSSRETSRRTRSRSSSSDERKNKTGSVSRASEKKHQKSSIVGKPDKDSNSQSTERSPSASLSKSHSDDKRGTKSGSDSKREEPLNLSSNHESSRKGNPEEAPLEETKENFQISQNLKSIRNEINDDGNKSQREAPVDPRKKVFPHHNSHKDISEAKKRYLLRKIARESAA